jgi:DNA topoisomerase-1
MVPAVFNQKKIEITGGVYQCGVSGSTLKFDGHLAVDRADSDEENQIDFASYHKGDELELISVIPTQHFTKPPPRFSDASLVKALEEDGIGRPSTYASIISTLVLRNYIMREKGYLGPTELGEKVSGLLVEYFSRIMDVGFTARMEERLDEVEDGKVNYPDLLNDFYTPFVKELEHAENSIERSEDKVGRPCPQCGKELIFKWGRKGKFISCSNFPECKYAEAITTGVPCPEENCDGLLVRRSSRRGAFYGCTNYPHCRHVSKDLPDSTVK